MTLVQEIVSQRKEIAELKSQLASALSAAPNAPKSIPDIPPEKDLALQMSRLTGRDRLAFFEENREGLLAQARVRRQQALQLTLGSPASIAFYRAHKSAIDMARD